MSTVGSGSIIFTRSSTSQSDTANTNTTKDNNGDNHGETAGAGAVNSASNPNRLAPYSPTHDTAQSTALDLLQLTSRDVFFDLGCGDGRLIIAALERCYDDDYLMRVHQERFAKLQLSQQLNEQQDHQHQNHKCNHHQQHHPQQRRHTSPANHIRQGSSTSFGSWNKSQHARSHSDYSVPHLMRTASQDDISDDASGIISSPYKIPHSKDSGDENNIDSSGRNSSENGGDGNESLLSAISPSSQQNYIMTPTSPVTPIMGNRGLRKIHLDVVSTSDGEKKLNNPPPSLPRDSYSDYLSSQHDEKNENNNEQEGEDELDDEMHKRRLSDSIPTTIETPSPNDMKTHCPQISELPTTDTLADQLAEQLLATVPSGDIFDENGIKQTWLVPGHEDNNVEPWESRASSSSQSLLGKGLQCVGIEYNQALAENAQLNVKKSYLYSHVAKKVFIRWGDVLDEWHRGNDGVSSSSRGDSNNDSFFVSKYESGNITTSNSNSNEGTEENHVSWNDLREEHHQLLQLEQRHQQQKQQQQQVQKISSFASYEDKGGDGPDASKLTLLNDATAVFVYLLPQGLKKVKPLLYEAAKLRHQQREWYKQQLELQAQHSRYKQQQMMQRHHPLQQQSLTGPLGALPFQDTNDYAEELGEQYSLSQNENECPLPGKQLISLHRKGYSHVSDITDYDFRNWSRTDSLLAEGANLQGTMVLEDPLAGIGIGNVVSPREGDIIGGQKYREAGNEQTRRTDQPNDTTSGSSSSIIPSFRVVSYMFSIPGWTPTKVDRSSKGGCPLYLYENIHEEEH